MTHTPKDSDHIRVDADGTLHAQWTGQNTEEMREAIAPFGHLYRSRDGKELNILLRHTSDSVRMLPGETLTQKPHQTK